jgi:hypothetical protein
MGNSKFFDLQFRIQSILACVKKSQATLKDKTRRMILREWYKTIRCKYSIHTELT